MRDPKWRFSICFHLPSRGCQRRKKENLANLFYGVWIARELHPDPRLLFVGLDGLWPSSVTPRILAGSAIQIFLRWNSMQILQKMLSSACILFMRESSLRNLHGGMSIFSRGLDSDRHYVHSVRVRSYSHMTFLHWRPRGANHL